MPSSNILANNILQYLFTGGAIIAKPTKVKLGLSTTIPNADETNITEPSGNAYAKVEMDCTTAMWDITVNKQLTNKSAVIFPKATGNWNTHTNTTADVLYAILYALDGTFLSYCQVPYKWIQTGTEYYIGVGNLKFKMI